MKEYLLTKLEETLSSFEKGYYLFDNLRTPIRLKRFEREQTICYLPPHIPKMEKIPHAKRQNSHCSIYVENVDVLEAALRMDSKELPPIVLNFANPFTPGGGVRRGARAQEESLCLRSSLLESLEGPQGLPYYNYHQNTRTFAASDAILITPQVEVIRDVNYQYLAESRIVSVLSCAAPLVSPFSHRLEDYSAEDMEILLYQRIKGIIATMIKHGYTHIVLGAWGCGAFCNDPNIIAKLFRRVLDEIDAVHYLTEICFAILCKSDNTNFDAFNKWF